MENVKKVIGCLALLAAIVTAAAQNYGSFGPLLTPAAGTWPANCLAVHMVHMPGGNVLIWGKRDYTFTKLYVRNSYTGQFLSEPSFGQWTVPGVDLFCAGHTLLPDGRVLIAGGTVNTDDGIRNTYLFDPVSLSWSDSGLMAQGRYYPSLVTLHDGNVAVVSGWREPDVPRVWADEVEIFHTATGAWTHFRPDPFIQPHYYPFLFTVYSAAVTDGGVPSMARYIRIS